MKTKISSLVLTGALCAFVVTPALSAAPVRNFGGTGVYSSAHSASTSKGTSSTTARAGGLRVVPTASKVTSSSSTSKPVSTTAPVSGTVSRASSNNRLSIGKFLPHRVVGAVDDEEMEFVSGKTEELEGTVEDLQGSLESAMGTLDGVALGTAAPQGADGNYALTAKIENGKIVEYSWEPIAR